MIYFWAYANVDLIDSYEVSFAILHFLLICSVPVGLYFVYFQNALLVGLRLFVDNDIGQLGNDFNLSAGISLGNVLRTFLVLLVMYTVKVLHFFAE